MNYRLYRGLLPLLALVCALLGGRMASGQNVYVPTDYATIGDALAASSSGWQVNVEPGTYFEGELVVPDGVYLIGSGIHRTFIQPPDPNGVAIHAGESYIRGLSIIGGQVGILFQNLLQQAYIEHVFIEGMEYGVFLESGSQPNQVPQVVMYNNGFVNNGTAVSMTFYTGVNLTFSENIVSGQYNGLVLQLTTEDYESSLTFANNIFWGCSGVAMDLSFVDGTNPSPAVDLFHNVFASNSTAFYSFCDTQGMGWVTSLNNVLLNNSIALYHATQYNQDCLPYLSNNHSGVSNPGVYQGFTPGNDEWNDASPFSFFNANAGDYLTNDFTLVAGSPFISNGDSQALGDDWDGSLCDIGAYGGSDAAYMDYDLDMDYYPADCDDHDPLRSTGYTELCDGIDNNCDGSLPPDELDNDGDGWSGCEGDCDDTRPGVNPDADEQDCDHLDTNCDGIMRPEEIDDDGDGVTECDGDCDDGNGDISPDMDEQICDDLDNDCDESTRDRPDEDNDGHGACEDDCDDTNPNVHPGQDEKCNNGVDDNCDGLTDGEDTEACPGGDDDDFNDDDDGADDDDSGPPTGFSCRCSATDSRQAASSLALLALVTVLASRIRRRFVR